MSDAAARREARRRKILENSENRLRRITGVQNKESEVPELNTKSSREQTNEIRAEDSSTSVKASFQSIPGNSPPRQVSENISPIQSPIEPPVDNDTDNELEDELLTLPRNTPITQQTAAPATSIIRSKRSLVVFALAFIVSSFVNLLNRYPIVSKEQFQYNLIFMPLLIYEFSSSLLFKDHMTSGASSSDLLSSVMLLMNARNRNFARVMRIFEKFTLIMQDVFIYFFAFVCSDLLVNSGNSIV